MRLGQLILEYGLAVCNHRLCGRVGREVHSPEMQGPDPVEIAAPPLPHLSLNSLASPIQSWPGSRAPITLLCGRAAEGQRRPSSTRHTDTPFPAPIAVRGRSSQGSESPTKQHQVSPVRNARAERFFRWSFGEALLPSVLRGAGCPRLQLEYLPVPSLAPQ